MLQKKIPNGVHWVNEFSGDIMIFIGHSIIHIKPNAIWSHTIYQSQCVHYKVTWSYVTCNQIAMCTVALTYKL